MSSEHELKVGVDLFKALTDMQGREPTAATPTVIVAAFLVAAAADYGLSDSQHLDGSHLDHVQPPVAGRSLIAHYFPSDSGVRKDVVDVEVVRNRLYEALVSLSNDTAVRQAVNKRDPLSQVGLLKIAQIYWNLESTPGRSRLPIASGQTLEAAVSGSVRADIKVPGTNKDFALLKHTPRCEIGADGIGAGTMTRSSGQAFRTHGARLAVQVAQWLVTHDRECPPANAHLQITSLEGRRKNAVISWETVNDLDIPLSTTALATVHTTLPDREIEEALERRAKAAFEAGDYRGAERSLQYLVSALQERSESEPFDHEEDLAECLAGHGLILARLGRTAEAIEACSSAIAILEVHAVMAPENDSARGLLAAALFLRADMLARQEDVLPELVRDTNRVLELVEAGSHGIDPVRVSQLLVGFGRLWCHWLIDGVGIAASREVGARLLRAWHTNVRAEAEPEEESLRAARLAGAWAHLLAAMSAKELGTAEEALDNALKAHELLQEADASPSQGGVLLAIELACWAYEKLQMNQAATDLALERVHLIANDHQKTALTSGPDQDVRMLRAAINNLLVRWERMAIDVLVDATKTLDSDDTKVTVLMALRHANDSFEALVPSCEAAVRTSASKAVEGRNELLQLIEKWASEQRSLVDGLLAMIYLIENGYQR